MHGRLQVKFGEDTDRTKVAKKTLSPEWNADFRCAHGDNEGKRHNVGLSVAFCIAYTNAVDVCVLVFSGVSDSLIHSSFKKC